MPSLLEKEVDEFRSPISKLMHFFHRSRNGWKRKCREAKQRCKLLANQVRAVENSRVHWRTLAEQGQQRIAQLEHELEDLKRGAHCG